MDVVACLEGGDQARVLSQVGDAAQLDLVVVGDQQLAARRSDERGAEHPSPLGPHRDVVQVGRVGAEPAGAGHRLVEGGPDAVVGADLGQQAHAVGGAQLLHLAVAEQVVHDGMLAPQLLQRLCVGGVAGLGALGGGEPEIVEQHFGNLLGRVDVDVAPRVREHLAAQFLGLGVEFVADRFQHRPVHSDPEVLHAGQHPDQRHLHLVVEAVQALRGQCLAQRQDQAVDGQRGPSRLLGGIDGVAAEVETPLLWGVGGRVCAGVAAGQVAQVVAGVGRVEEVGGQHGVDQRVAHLDAAVHQRAHQGLGAVRGERPGRAAVDSVGGAGHETGERGRDGAVVQQVAGHEGHPAAGRVDHPRQTALEPLGRGGQRQGPARRPLRSGVSEGFHRLGRGLEHQNLGYQRPCRRAVTAGGVLAERVAEGFDQAGVQRAELEKVEQLADRLGVDLSEGEVVEPGVQRHVAHEQHHLGVGADPLLGGREVLPELGRQVVQGAEDPVQPSPFVDQLGRGLLAHPGHSGQVVAGVAPQGRILHVVGGPHAGAVQDAGLVVQLALRPPVRVVVVEHLDPGVLHQLVGVAVAGYDDHVIAGVAALGGQGGEHVVGLVARRVHRGHGQGVKDFPHQAHLLAQDVGGRVAGPLVGGNHGVPEGRLGPVEGDHDLVGLMVAPQVDEHRREAEHCVGDLARRGGHVGGQGEEGAIGQRVAVDQHHLGHGGESTATRPGAGQSPRREAVEEPRGRHGAIWPPSTSPATSRIVRRCDMAVRWMNT